MGVVHCHVWLHVVQKPSKLWFYCRNYIPYLQTAWKKGPSPITASSNSFHLGGKKKPQDIGVVNIGNLYLKPAKPTGYSGYVSKPFKTRVLFLFTQKCKKKLCSSPRICYRYWHIPIAFKFQALRCSTPPMAISSATDNAAISALSKDLESLLCRLLKPKITCDIGAVQMGAVHLTQVFMNVYDMLGYRYCNDIQYTHIHTFIYYRDLQST